MQTFLSLHVPQLLVFLLVVCRVGGLVATAPLFGTREVPLQVRLFLVVALSGLLAPMYWASAVRPPDTTAGFLLLAVGEILIGVALGLGVTIILSSALMAGRLISQACGISLADVLSPGVDEEVPVHSHLMFLVTLTVFVALGGHRLVIGALLDTFANIPPGTSIATASLPQTMVTLVAESFQLGLRAAAPALTALLLSTIALAIIGRTLPQLNIMALGFSVNVATTLLVLAVSLGTASYLLSDRIGPALELVVHSISEAGGGHQ